MEKIKIINQKNVFARATSESVLFLSLAVLVFSVPIILRGPQLLVGTIINAILIKGALTLKKDKFIALAIFPSLGVLSAGFLFNGLTSSLIYLLPFIWIANYLLMTIFKVLEKKNYIKALLSSAFLKAGFLFSGVFILYKLNLVPKIILSSMGYLQFITVIFGSLLVLTGLKL